MEHDKLELVRQALAELGDVSAEELATFIERRHGLRIDPRYIPLMRASLRGRELLGRGRDIAKSRLEIRGSTDGSARSDVA